MKLPPTPAFVQLELVYFGDPAGFAGELIAAGLVAGVDAGA